MNQKLWRLLMINPFKRIAEGFILTVGITPPRPGHEQTAALFISALLGGTLLIAIAAFVLFLRVLL